MWARFVMLAGYCFLYYLAVAVVCGLYILVESYLRPAAPAPDQFLNREDALALSAASDDLNDVGQHL